MKNARTVVAVLVVGALALAACGGSSTDPDQPTSTTAAVAADAGDAGDAAAEPSEDIEEFVEEVTDSLVDLQESEGGGTATLTVGGETWTFGSVLCAFGEEMIGQEGAVFNLSGIQDGLQLYAATDSFGDLVSLNDIEDFENPSVALERSGRQRNLWSSTARTSAPPPSSSTGLPEASMASMGHSRRPARRSSG